MIAGQEAEIHIIYSSYNLSYLPKELFTHYNNESMYTISFGAATLKIYY